MTGSTFRSSRLPEWDRAIPSHLLTSLLVLLQPCGVDFEIMIHAQFLPW